MDFSQEKHPAGSVWNLLLFQKFYDFDVYFEPIIERFPAFEKSAWCAQIKNTLIDTSGNVKFRSAEILNLRYTQTITPKKEWLEPASEAAARDMQAIFNQQMDLTN